MTILDLPLATHETSDYVPLAIKAAVFYRIIDPLKALVRIQNIPKQIQETSTATLAGIIRGSSLADVASRSTPFYHPKQKNKIKRHYDKREEKQEQTSDYDAEQDIETDIPLQVGGGGGFSGYKSIPIQPYSPKSQPHMHRRHHQHHHIFNMYMMNLCNNYMIMYVMNGA